MSDYRGLKVYQKSYEMVLRIYQDVSCKVPAEERYGLIGQIKRAAVGVSLNIAEGYGRGMGDKETIRFLMMARGSVNEVQVLLELLKDLGYLSQAEYQDCAGGYEEVGKMLTGLKRTLTKD